MRASVLLVPMICVMIGVACQQEIDHPEAAATCDPAVTKCIFTPPAAMGTNGNAGGDSSVGEETGTFSGSLVAFNDDYFDRGDAFTGLAKVSAASEGGGRVTADYDGTRFELNEVLKDPGNWFWVEPVGGTGMIPTLIPVDTRRAKSDRVTVGVVNGLDVDNIFGFLNTERSAERAQVVLTLLDKELRSVPGVTGTLTSEVTAYRAAGGWVGDDFTDDSGMIFFGNVRAGSALDSVSISLTGAVTGRVDVKVAAGAVTVVSAIVDP